MRLQFVAAGVSGFAHGPRRPSRVLRRAGPPGRPLRAATCVTVKLVSPGGPPAPHSRAWITLHGLRARPARTVRDWGPDRMGFSRGLTSRDLFRLLFRPSIGGQLADLAVFPRRHRTLQGGTAGPGTQLFRRRPRGRRRTVRELDRGRGRIPWADCPAADHSSASSNGTACVFFRRR